MNGNKVVPNDATVENGQVSSTKSRIARSVDFHELGFYESKTEEEQLDQLKKCQELARPISVKRDIRKRLLDQNAKKPKSWKANSQMRRRQCSIACKNLSYRIELWKESFKVIEGHFGSGILSYFLFLKWLFQLDLGIAALILLFIVLPQAALNGNSNGSTATYPTPCTEVNSSLYDGLKWYGNVVPTCTANYELYLNETANNQSSSVTAYLVDFLQGTGFMEDTILFYGYYSSVDLSVGISAIEEYVSSYNMPLAYIVVTVVCFLLSLILMVKQSAGGVRDSIVSGQEKANAFSTHAFSSWDFGLCDAMNVALKKKSLRNEIITDLDELRDLKRRKDKTTKQLCLMWTVRILINIVVLILLGGAGYFIFYVTQLSTEIISSWPEYSTYELPLQFLIEFSPSLTITVLNVILPAVFEKIVGLEDYVPETELKITLYRTVFLRLASLAMLLATLYSEISCSPKDSCNVGTSPCQPLYCWETGVGQQIYKLLITDAFVPIIVTLFVEFPRKLIVQRCGFKMVGYQQFDLTKNVLDLVYTQTLCWLGAFFSPLIPLICLLKFFVLFYLKKISLLSNFVPSSRIAKASGSNSFFIVVLLLAFLLCSFPIVYVLSWMTPSRGCGPFRPHDAMLDALIVTICTWSTGFQDFLNIVTSVAVSVPLLTILCLVVYYQSKVSSAYKKRVEVLNDQLITEGKDKQFLAAELNKQRKDGNMTAAYPQTQQAPVATANSFPPGNQPPVIDESRISYEAD